MIGAIIRFVTCLSLSVCLSVRPHGTIRLPLDGNLMSEHFSKILHEYLLTFMITSRSVLLRMRIFFRVKFVQEIKTRILSSTTFFFENRGVYEIIWKDMVKLDTPQITIYHGP